MRISPLSLAIKSLSAAMAIGVASYSSLTFAEESADSDEEVEEVIVTGSRIARDSNLDSPSPIQSVSADDIQASGEFNISDVVNDIPALLGSTTTAGSNGSAFADGANILELRGLGENRTLVLVNGKRHVGGSQGSSSVDVGSIPVGLIENIEVLTGGASAVYGADAVTGVVNFILKDDYEGMEFNARVGSATEGDATQYVLSGLFGQNFDDGRGNITVSLDYNRDKGLRASERSGGELVGTGRDWLNPARRFQQGDIDPTTMPNFAAYYAPANDRPAFGSAIPETSDAFVSIYNAAFGSDPTLTQAELDFITAAAATPPRAVLPGRTFPFTSGYGMIIPGNPYTFSGFDPNVAIDLDGNGVNDCYDSYTGYNSSFGADAFGVIGGCWNVNADGSYRPVRDGLVANGFQGFGGDSFNTIQQSESWLLVPEEKINLNLLGRYELTDSLVAKAEFKYTNQYVENTTQPTSFWDLLFGAPDNPYLPDFIQPVANANGGVAITMDPIFIGGGESENTRDTIRTVFSLEGELDNGWTYEGSAVYGKFTRETVQNDAIINDRFLAAIDAVTDPTTGEPACRSQIDTNAAPVSTPFGIPVYDDSDYYTFTPGDGTCVPLNIWAGASGVTQEAIDWVTVDEISKIELEQTVVSGFLAGDSEEFFNLPGGPIAFAVGAEYRKETATATFDDWQKGVLPAGSNFTPGSLISEHSDNTRLTFRPTITIQDERGSYDVKEAFLEVSLPILNGMPFVEELTTNFAGRVSDYSTIGQTTTWKADLLYSPFTDLLFRTTTSEAVRAPNITELFGPQLGATFRPADPCDFNQIDDLSDTQLAASTEANCIAYFDSIGFTNYEDGNGNYNFTDPLTAAFPGFTGGNRNLTEETANTLTAGFVFTPEFVDGFNITMDYWEIELESAINAVTGQNIADGCFKGSSLNDAFCELLGRSTTNGGFNYMLSTSVNFAKRETSGIDFSVGYDFEFGEHEFSAKLAGTRVIKLDDFSNIDEPDDKDKELGELGRPELAGNFNFSWAWRDLNVSWQSQYVGEQLLGFVEIDTYKDFYGEAVVMDEMLIHDLFASYILDEYEIYGGFNNITDEKPYITSYAFPASTRGASLFFGVNMEF